MGEGVSRVVHPSQVQEEPVRNPVECSRGQYVDIDRIRRMVEDSPYDAIIVTSPENVPYYSGFYNIDLRLIPERFHFVVWPKIGEPAFVVVERRKRNLKSEDTFITDIVGYEGEGLDTVRALVEVLADRRAATGSIGIEGRNFPGSYLKELERRLGQATFEDARTLLESVRWVKTPAEVEVLTRAARATTDAIDAAFLAARPGDAERSISARMHAELIRNGADMVSAPIFGAGDRSGAWHTTANDARIEAGMMVKTDLGGLFDGYYSDIARTAVMGKASGRQREIYRKATEIKHRIVEGIQPGMVAADVAHLGRRAYADVGLEFKWSILGHGIGLGVHEAPQIYTWSDEPVLPGMTMMIETGYTNPPGDSVHIEDLILVTDAGAKYLTDATRHEDLWELGI